ncbi:MAG: Bax inhibitor-1/YccA family protein [Synergistaceae bacterium]|nr:Bax inhibitor-1/YccA family protein [Synergistaceae bacterium]MBQ3653205.1 Bax inhibitor-1/YccA family protein [Synergistaceae bacterium]
MAPMENYMPYSAGTDSVEAVNALFRKVYQYMAAGLILTALAAYLSASSQFMLQLLYTSQVPMIVIAVAELGLVLWISAGINKISASTARNLFFVYSVLNGILCSSVLLVYTGESVYKAFLSTAGMFGAMSLYGIYTKRDLTSMGGFLTMGLFGLIIAMVINMFVGSSRVELYISIFGIIIFLGLTAYDTAKIKVLAANTDGEGGEFSGKIAVLGALALYLDFVNIFLYLLRLFGERRR